MSRVQLPRSSAQESKSPGSSVQSPASNCCIQSPGIPVCPQKAASKWHIKLKSKYCKKNNSHPMEWFLYYTILRRNLYNKGNIFNTYSKKLFLYEINCLFADFFFYLGFLSQSFMNCRTAGEGGGYLSNSSLPPPPASQPLRH